MFFERNKSIKVELINEKFEVSVSFRDGSHNFILSAIANIDDLNIESSHIEINKAPYLACDEMNNLVARVSNIKVEAGFTKKLKSLIGGRMGCTHLLDMFQELARGLVQAQLKYKYRDQLKEVLKDNCIAY